MSKAQAINRAWERWPSIDAEQVAELVSAGWDAAVSARPVLVSESEDTTEYTPTLQANLDKMHRWTFGTEGEFTKDTAREILDAVASVRADERKQIFALLRRLKAVGLVNSTYRVNGMTYNETSPMPVSDVIALIESERAQFVEQEAGEA